MAKQLTGRIPPQDLVEAEDMWREFIISQVV